MRIILSVLIILLSFSYVYSDRLNENDSTPPAQPSGLTASFDINSESVKLNWTANTESDLLYYEVYRTENTSRLIDPDIFVSKVNFFSDDRLKSDTTYYYSVCAYDKNSNKSINSSIVSVYIDDSQLSQPPEVSGLTLTPKVLSAKAEWDKYEGPAFLNYNIYISDTNFSDVSNMDAVANIKSADENVYNFTVLKKKKYYVAVTIVKTSGKENKTVKTVSVTPLGDEIPSDKFEYEITAGDKQAVFSWDALSDSSFFKYIIYYSEKEFSLPSEEVSKIEITDIAQNSYTLQNLVNDKTYYCTIIVEYYNGNTTKEPEYKTFVPKQATPQQIMLKGHFKGLTAKLSWDISADDNFKQYNIYYSSSNFSNVSNITAYTIITNKEQNSISIEVSAYDKNYYFAVTQTNVNNIENTEVSTLRLTSSSEPLIEVSGLSGFPRDKAVLLKWEAITDQQFSEYIIFYDTKSFTDTSNANYSITINDKEATEYLISGLTNGQEYYFAITAKNMSGNIQTQVSPIKVTPGTFKITNVKAISRYNAIRISWDAIEMSDFSSYNIYLIKGHNNISDVSGLTPNKQIFDQTINATEIFDLNDSKEYTIIVTATLGEDEFTKADAVYQKTGGIAFISNIINDKMKLFLVNKDLEILNTYEPTFATMPYPVYMHPIVFIMNSRFEFYYFDPSPVKKDDEISDAPEIVRGTLKWLELPTFREIDKKAIVCKGVQLSPDDKLYIINSITGMPTEFNFSKEKSNIKDKNLKIDTHKTAEMVFLDHNNFAISPEGKFWRAQRSNEEPDTIDFYRAKKGIIGYSWEKVYNQVNLNDGFSDYIYRDMFFLSSETPYMISLWGVEASGRMKENRYAKIFTQIAGGDDQDIVLRQDLYPWAITAVAGYDGGLLAHMDLIDGDADVQFKVKTMSTSFQFTGKELAGELACTMKKMNKVDFYLENVKEFEFNTNRSEKYIEDMRDKKVLNSMIISCFDSISDQTAILNFVKNIDDVTIRSRYTKILKYFSKFSKYHELKDEYKELLQEISYKLNKEYLLKGGVR